MEYVFLRDTTKWLQPGGLIIYIVPQNRVDARMAGFLTTAYGSLRPYRFPDPEYSDFRQVVIFGIAKKEPMRDDKALLALVQACRGDLRILPEEWNEDELYSLPRPDDTRFYFRGSEIDPNEAFAEAVESGAWKTIEWQEWLSPKTELAPFRRLMPLKKGHLAMLIAAGLMQNLLLESSDGMERLLVKGRTYKVQEEVPSDDEDEEILRDRFVTEIVALDLNTGSHVKIAEPTALAEFVEKWRDVLTKRVMETFVPLYQFDLAAEGDQVQATLNRLSKHRHVPGRKETGLFPAQKHVAVALWKRLQHSNSAIMVGEMGVGKCVLPDTRVQVNGNLLSIAEAWERYGDPQSEWSDGDGVWRKPKEPMWVPTYDEQSGEIRLGEVQRLYRQEIHESVKEISLIDGSCITVTQSHPFLTPREWTNRVHPGDYIAVPLHVPWLSKLYAEIVPPDFIGWQIAEGHEQRRPSCLRLYQKDESVLARLLRQTDFLTKIPGYRSQPRIKKYPGRCPFLEIASGPFAKYLIERGYVWGTRSGRKVIPPFIMQGDVNAVRLFLQAYCDAEGHASNRGIELITASERMAHQLIELFRRLGITASLHPKIAYAANTRERIKRTYFRIQVTGEAARRFRDHVGFTVKKKSERLIATCAESPNSNVETIYVADIVRRVSLATGLGRKVSGNLLGHVYTSGKEPTMNRDRAERLMKFIKELLAGDVEKRYGELKHHNYRALRVKLMDIDRDALEEARQLLESRLKQEIRFSRVVSVTTRFYTGPVYDLEVEGTHNFIANQILVHNTTIASAVADLIRECDGDPRPNLVLCPPYLVNKWIREIQQIVPLAFAMPLYRLSDVTQFVRQVSRLAPGTPAFAVLSREMAKLGSGWRPAYVVRRKYERVELANGKTKVIADEAFACPQCGKEVWYVEEGRETAPVRNAEYFSERKRRCFGCGEAFYQMIHLNGATLGTRTEPPSQVRLVDAETNGTRVTQRYPIADFIARRHRGLFKLLIADEVHQMNGQSTDQGYALGSLVRACDKTLALTGTIFGGRSTSLFFLLHRLSPRVRTQFKWNEAQRWAERYGILLRRVGVR